MGARAEFEYECLTILTKFSCHVAAYAGYMRKATHLFVNQFLGVNVHPADLTIRLDNGKPKFRGDKAVRNALREGEKELRSTTHIITEKVDCGPVLMVSGPLEVKYPIPDEIIEQMAESYQDKLKEIGDWEIFPKTLEYMADGKYSRDEKGNLYFDGNPISNGVRLNYINEIIYPKTFTLNPAIGQ